MRILGIDPGYDRLGIAILDKSSGKTGGKESLVYSSCFTTSKKDSIYERLGAIGEEISRIIEEFKPEALALESLFITKNQKTAMRVSEARGIIMYEGIKRNIPIFEYSPMQIKMAVTGDGSSDKTRITKMVKILVKIPAPQPLSPKKEPLDDEYDAIAVAITHSAMARSLIHSNPLLQK